MTTTFDIAKRAAVSVVLTAATIASVVPVLPGPAAAGVSVPASSPFALPAPTGAFPVGRDVLHLIDRSRRDPWTPSMPRELMVSMFYPAATGSGRPARYLSEAEIRPLLEARGLTGVISPEAVRDTRTSATAAAAPRRGRFPLVVLSPGFSLHRHTLTHLAEELASRGYVVAAVDHAYESFGTAFPGGRVLPFTALDVTETVGYASVVTVRAADISFLLDRLTGARPAWRHAGVIDRFRIGVAGHSAGGAAAATTTAADPRVRAGVNMDGGFFVPIPEAGMAGRPFLMLGAQSSVPGQPGPGTWDDAWQALDGWKRWITVTGTGHTDFTDFPILGDQAGLPDPGSPVTGARAAQLTRRYVGAFFDLHLRGIPQPLLDGPSATEPEAVFHQP